MKNSPALKALDFAQFLQPDLPRERFERQIERLAGEVRASYDSLVTGGAAPGAVSRVHALKYVLCERHGFAESPDRAESPDYYLLPRLLDTGIGHPLALAILTCACAREIGWAVDMVILPGGRGICRIEEEGERLFFDPAKVMKLLQAHDLRALLKEALGDRAELSLSYLEPVTDEQAVIAHQNLLKSRFIALEEYDAALKLVEKMIEYAPDEYRLRLDAGVLCARLGRGPQALSYLEYYIDRAPSALDRADARALMEQVRYDMRAQLND